MAVKKKSCRTVRAMWAILAVVGVWVIASGCRLGALLAPLVATISPTTSAPELSATAAAPGLTQTAEVNETRPTPIPECAYMWDIRSLPETSARLKATLEQAGLPQVIMTAEAYGETCVNTMDHTVGNFSILQTDFKMKARVLDLADEEEIGILLAEVTRVINGLPVEALPGRQPGIVSVELTSGESSQNMRFELGKAMNALEKGLAGKAFLEALR